MRGDGETTRREQMAIGAIFAGSGFSQEQYAQVNRQASPDNQPPPGLRYHAAGPSESGFCVIEVWESQEAMQQFFERKLGQALQQANVNVQPVFFQVTNIMEQ
jgi:quinol monooxygenase YgiN